MSFSRANELKLVLAYFCSPAVVAAASLALPLLPAAATGDDLDCVAGNAAAAAAAGAARWEGGQSRGLRRAKVACMCARGMN